MNMRRSQDRDRGQLSLRRRRKVLAIVPTANAEFRDAQALAEAKTVAANVVPPLVMLASACC